MPQCCPLCRYSYKYNSALISHISTKPPNQATLCLHEPTIIEPTTDDQGQADERHELEEYQSELRGDNADNMLIDYDSDKESVTKSNERNESD